ncbi:DUF2496 domain-containing protein [Thalassotalea litorea]|uniref:DUF2496 domain-containing protein n=1 Tax=Thalassotalea litorea TaxID=2020715 RepID=A0A5R9INU2_9GAMM|nr:DUF2496 domain-containing protein [Thalassotalea litorea]TLU67214.1 DUF2496 domain-containing protein [Thalassotalea litorea]
MSLDREPAHVQLAVDLIQLLEENKVAADTVLAALPLVIADYQNKLRAEQGNERNSQ